MTWTLTLHVPVDNRQWASTIVDDRRRQSILDDRLRVYDDMNKWVDSLTFDEAMIEFKEYWDEYFTDTIEEVRECINDN